jgi:hypothetical protein
MPWNTQGDVARHNKRAGKSKRKGKVWRKVANATLARTGNEGRAIREANAVAGRMYGKK